MRIFYGPHPPATQATPTYSPFCQAPCRPPHLHLSTPLPFDHVNVSKDYYTRRNTISMKKRGIHTTVITCKWGSDLCTYVQFRFQKEFLCIILLLCGMQSRKKDIFDHERELTTKVQEKILEAQGNFDYQKKELYWYVSLKTENKFKFTVIFILTLQCTRADNRSNPIFSNKSCLKNSMASTITEVM